MSRFRAAHWSRTVEPAPLAGRRPANLLAVRLFLVALAALLAGYMFLGRGFAHLGMPPVFVGEIVLGIGLIASGIAIVQLRLRMIRSWLAVLLVLFMLLGVARTVPYVGTYGVNALRDAVLWGYGAFALIIYVLADRALLLGGTRLYGAVVPLFALWVPIAWYVFGALQDRLPLAPGSEIPILFFKNQDMAVHTVGAIAFLVVGTSALTNAAQFLWRFLVAVPLAWTVYVTGSISRGAVAAVVAGLGVLVLLAPRSRNWGPVLVAGLVLVIALVGPGALTGMLPPGPSPQTSPSVSAFPSSPSPSGQPAPTEAPTAVPTPQPAPTDAPTAVPTPQPAPTDAPTAVPTPQPAPTDAPTAVPTPQPAPTDGRALSPSQWFENIASVILKSSNEGLEGTKQFRLAWWTKIVDYTVFGPYFWTGKGFGINLADDDGFQPNADGSLRSPHNSHITALARMGVPGFALWLLLQVAFAIQLLRSLLAHRRDGDAKVAAVGAWILVYWAAMMVNTSFDPYLEGPQGGIWFWTLFGFGLVVIRLTPRHRKT